MLKKIFALVLFCSLNYSLPCFASAEDEDTQARSILSNVDPNYHFEFSLAYVLGSRLHTYNHLIDFVSSHEPLNYQNLSPLLRREFERMNNEDLGEETYVTAFVIVRGSNVPRPLLRENHAYLYSVEIFTNEERSASLEISFFRDIYLEGRTFQSLYYQDRHTVVEADANSSSSGEWTSGSETEEEKEESPSNQTTLSPIPTKHFREKSYNNGKSIQTLPLTLLF